MSTTKRRTACTCNSRRVRSAIRPWLRGFALAHRLAIFTLLAFLSGPAAQAQALFPLAQELVALKGGYIDKKRDVEELRIRAYIPFLLKAVGKGPAWKPGHPNWESLERRIAGEWRKHYTDHMARMGRDTSYVWMDDAIAREYARLFSADEINALLDFYRSEPGAVLLALEREFLDFYPAELVRSLTRVMLGNDVLSDSERAAFRSPENRRRRDFAMLFESENVLNEEGLRIGGAFVAANPTDVQHGALATAAGGIDTLRQKLEAATTQAAVLTFLKSDLGLKEREFIALAILTVTPAQEDPAAAKQEVAAFYKGLGDLSAQWRTLANAKNESTEPP